MEILTFLTGISPWWWVAAAIALFVVEMLTFTYFVIWIAIAAALMGLAVWLVPDLGGSAQLSIFAALSVAVTIGGRFALRKFPRASGADGDGAVLNARAARMIGRTCRATEAFDGQEGTVELDQITWRARLADGTAEQGTKLKVVGVDHMTLLCEIA